MYKYFTVFLFSSSLILNSQIDNEKNNFNNFNPSTLGNWNINKHNPLLTSISFYQDEKYTNRLRTNSMIDFAPSLKILKKQPDYYKGSNNRLNSTYLGNVFSSMSGTLVFGSKPLDKNK